MQKQHLIVDGKDMGKYRYSATNMFGYNATHIAKEALAGKEGV